MDTCDGQICFVRAVKSTSSNQVESIDRGCFSQLLNDLIDRICSGDTMIQGNILAVYSCCNDIEFCNANLTVHFRPNTTASPTTALSPAATIPVGETHVSTCIPLSNISLLYLCVWLMKQIL